MRVALLGNTCNNNFALMRYLRDLGVDAHLLLYSNEGIEGNNIHYSPEYDTFHFNKWKVYIHRLPVMNGIESIVGRLDKMRMPPSKTFLKSAFQGYDCYIGSGISPGIFARMGKKLTVYYPYGTGVEWVGEAEFVKKLKNINMETLLRYYVRYKQKQGIHQSAICVNSEMSATADTLNKMGKRFLGLSVPQYYNREIISHTGKDPFILNIIATIKKYDFVVFSHMRQLWSKNSKKKFGNGWNTMTKNNNWLIEGFSSFFSTYGNSNALLVLTEWGDDVEYSKLLVKELGIQKQVLWLPLLARKQLILIMRECDISVGQFGVLHKRSWGSTTLESLSNRMPTLQTFNFTQKEYTDEFGYAPPPFLDVKSKNDVTKHLCDMYIDKDAKIRIGKLSKVWFDRHNGIRLAEKWLAILKNDCKLN